MMNYEEADIEVVQEVVDQIRPLLAGKGPHIQGAIIADLVAIFIAAHAPPIREEAKENLFMAIDALVTANEHLMFPDGKHPYTVAMEAGEVEP